MVNQQKASGQSWQTGALKEFERLEPSRRKLVLVAFSAVIGWGWYEFVQTPVWGYVLKYQEEAKLHITQKTAKDQELGRFRQLEKDKRLALISERRKEETGGSGGKLANSNLSYLAQQAGLRTKNIKITNRVASMHLSGEYADFLRFVQQISDPFTGVAAQFQDLIMVEDNGLDIQFVIKLSE